MTSLMNIVLADLLPGVVVVLSSIDTALGLGPR